MTITVNANGDICAIQKAGGLGVTQSDIMRCLRLASRNAESITKKIKDAVSFFYTKVFPKLRCLFCILTAWLTEIEKKKISDVYTEYQNYIYGWMCGFLYINKGPVFLCWVIFWLL